MTVRNLLDSTGDISTSGTQFISGIDETAQTVRTRLKLLLGEYFRNIDEGTPWFERIFPNTANQSLKETEIKRIITQTENVGAITSFELEYERTEKRLTVDCSIIDISGSQTNITLSEVF